MPFPVAGTVKRCRHRSMRESSFPVFGLVLGEISQRATRCIDCRCRRPDARERPRKQQVSKSDIARSTNRTPVIGCRSCETHESKTFARGKIWLFRSVPRQRRCIAMRYASACWSLRARSRSWFIVLVLFVVTNLWTENRLASGLGHQCAFDLDRRLRVRVSLGAPDDAHLLEPGLLTRDHDVVRIHLLTEAGAINAD